MIYSVQNLYDQYAKQLELDLIGANRGMKRKIRKPELHRPGLSLSGYLKNFSKSRIFVFGKGEVQYLRELAPEIRMARLETILSSSTPAVILARKMKPLKELLLICKRKGIPLFRSSMKTIQLFSNLSFILTEVFCPSTTLHGTLIEVFGIGVLIQGDSSVGKSEAALGLVERGHRLISDDIVKIRKREGSFLVGEGPELTRHLMEIRGIGIINVANLYGAVCVRPDKGLDIVIKLEEWDDSHFYDRVGLEDKFCDILGVNMPYHTLPVKPGRDVVLLIETTALNHRLKEMGYNSAKEFNVKLLEMLSKRKRKVHENYSKSQNNE